MKKIALYSLVALLSLGAVSCSERERRKKKHAFDDELELIEKAKKATEKASKKAEKQLEEIEKALDD